MKGVRNGQCNWDDCTAQRANYYNRGSFSWYCEACASVLNRFNTDIKFEDGRRMVIYVSPTLSDVEAAERTKFTKIV